MTRRFIVVIAAVAVLLGASSFAPTGARLRAETLPSRLSDQDFWKLSADLSEPGGTFRSDNLLSNERGLQFVIPDLLRTAKSGRVYMGVGPEQNFTYITSLEPSMAFIVDVRRGNLQLHLMYKALFELSKDRVEFVSRLFSRKRPDRIERDASAAAIFEAFGTVEPSDALYAENLKAIEKQLTSTHGFALTGDDLEGIEYVYHAFFTFGPELRYSSTGGFGGRFQPTYADLMTATDEDGTSRGYLASEKTFAFLKDLEATNRLVPVVGNFAGPKALRGVGAYVKAHGGTVSAFYLSNVEQYLYQNGVWRDFCENVATLPLDANSTFIRSTRRGGFSRGFGLTSELVPMASTVSSCGTE